MSKKIALLSCSRSQLEYFSVLSEQLKQDKFAEIELLNYKKIQISLFYFLQIIINPPSLPSLVHKNLLKQVDYYLKRKQNTASGQKRSLWYWSVTSYIQKKIAYYLFFHYQRYFSNKSYSHIIVWNGKKFHQAIACIAAQYCYTACLYMETGPLPGYMQISPYGVDANSNLPKNADFYQSYTNTEYTEILDQTDLNENKVMIAFVPFQVVEDSNIYYHSPWIANMRELYRQLEICVETNPQLTILIKEHPQCDEYYEDLKNKHSRLIFQPLDKPIAELLQKSHFVMTVNSTVGMEALLVGKPLITLGEAIYNVETIVQYVKNDEQLQHAIEKISAGWQPNLKVVNGFINYLQNEYAIKGDMDYPTSNELALMSEKIQEIIWRPLH